jgi:hypothetical protein
MEYFDSINHVQHRGRVRRSSFTVRQNTIELNNARNGINHSYGPIRHNLS